MAASYRVLIKASAEKEIRLLPKGVRRRVVQKIAALSLLPRPPGCEKLSGRSAYRVRVGSYRIVYSVVDSQLIVEVVRVAHRREVYR